MIELAQACEDSGSRTVDLRHACSSQWWGILRFLPGPAPGTHAERRWNDHANNEETLPRGDPMKFLVLLAQEDHFDRWDAASEADQQDFFDGHAAFLAAVRAQGQVLAVQPLQRPETAVTL